MVVMLFFWIVVDGEMPSHSRKSTRMTGRASPRTSLKSVWTRFPRDKPLVLICNTGVRSYEAQLELKEKGITDTYNLQGGMATVKKWGLDL